MKRRILSFICAIAVLLTCIPFALAADAPDTTVSVRYLENGDYIVSELTQYPTLTRSSTTSGEKSDTYHTADGKRVVTLTVYGTFSYTGSSSEATKADYSVTRHTSEATINSKRAYTSGKNAIAKASFTCSDVSDSMSVKLTCSSTGELS